MVIWKDALSDLSAHENLQYHLDSVAKLAAFQYSVEHPAEQIDHTISEASSARVQKNREILISIVKCLELCARQGLALHGHRDEFDSDHLNQGKFRAMHSRLPH